jgi:hypothetical protein
VAVAVFACTVFVHVYGVAAEADPAPSAIVAAAPAPARVTAIHFRIDTFPCRLGPREARGGRDSALGDGAAQWARPLRPAGALARCARVRDCNLNGSVALSVVTFRSLS